MQGGHQGAGWFYGVGWLQSRSMGLGFQIGMRVRTPHCWAGSGLLQMIELKWAQMAHSLLSNWNSRFHFQVRLARHLSMLHRRLGSKRLGPMAQRQL